ncbi:recombinase family protein [Sphingobium sp. ZW T5_29]|uniref:recombinase family protein n=1 Tax=Sphingobium sp. ZW T5_29 TaxID=3378077 RepID=UPI0038519720
MNDRNNAKAIAYLRVSTDKQGRSGLGLEAQREAVGRFAASNGMAVIHEYLEVETGKGANALAKRPQLAAALVAAKKERATVVVAKLDRLARNTKFLLTLIESGADVAFADMPQVAGPMGKFILTQMAAVAELEAGLISQRTKAALKASKERGTELGKHGKVLAGQNKADALQRASTVAPELLEMRASGMSMRKIVETMNERGVPSPTGGKWHLTSLHRVMGRLEDAAAAGPVPI